MFQIRLVFELIKQRRFAQNLLSPKEKPKACLRRPCCAGRQGQLKRESSVAIKCAAARMSRLRSQKPKHGPMRPRRAAGSVQPTCASFSVQKDHRGRRDTFCMHRADVCLHVDDLACHAINCTSTPVQQELQRIEERHPAAKLALQKLAFQNLAKLHSRIYGAEDALIQQLDARMGRLYAGQAC
jgi:hypothetical protein